MKSQTASPFARKRFGQHFLRDSTTIQRIIRLIDPLPGQSLVEIGPGRGALTKPLLQAAQRLEAIELDRDLISSLQNQCQGLGELCVYSADALTFDFSRLCRNGHLLRVVGNLPYNIATPLIFHLFHQAAYICDMHFMLQREVVERMVARPATAAYGRLSVMTQYYSYVEWLFDVEPDAFRPPPKVKSAFIRVQPHRQPPVRVNDERWFAEVVRQAFSQRRKTLRNALRPLFSIATIEAAGINPGMRSECLTLKDFAALSNISNRSLVD
jgi:16S rRNA (adenine1518-N6/adenine1519-N6)-dimethyltransferase